MVLRIALPGRLFVSSVIVRQLTLAVGVLGGAIAARENRLLSLSSALSFLKGSWRSRARLVGGVIAVAVTALLAFGSARFVQSEKQAGDLLAFGIPSWVIELLLPVGFAIVTERLAWHSANGWRGRLVALLLAGVVVSLTMWLPVSPGRLVVPALGLLLLATVCGAPVFVTLGGAALILFWGDGLPIASLAVDHYRLVTNPTLPAIPLFTLAGYLLAEGGASRRLIRVFQSLVGSIRGGPAIVTALACAFFTSFTGASGVTILALGGLLMPVLLAARFSERSALGLLTCAGSLGLLFPPCLPLILYAIFAKVPIKEMFWGGVLPGLVLVLATVLWGIFQAPHAEGPRRRFDSREARMALWEAKWELLIPVIALASLLSGYATAVEAAALTAFYALVVETLVYRDLRLFGDLPRVMTQAGLVVGGILLILGVALGFTNYLVDAQVPFRAVDWATRAIQNQMNQKSLCCCLFLILAVGQPGCASRRAQVRTFTPPAWHAESATIGVRAAGQSPPLIYSLPMIRGEVTRHYVKRGFKSGGPVLKAAGSVFDAGAGAGEGAVITTIPAGALAGVGVASSAVGTFVGAVTGPLAGVSESKRRKAEAALPMRSTNTSSPLFAHDVIEEL